MVFLVQTWFRSMRVEGGLEFAEDNGGALRLGGGRWRGVERLLRGRDPLEAVQLTQQISGDSGVAHGLAALRAYEQAAGIDPLEEGLLLRELLHALSQLHGHVRHFYFQVLPDYLPAGALKRYRGRHAMLRKAAERAASSKNAWKESDFPSALTQTEQQQLLEHQADCLAGLERIQRMLAVLGGKFPVVMSLAPGGLTAHPGEAGLLRLKTLYQTLPQLVEDMLAADVELLLARHSELRFQGQVPAEFLSVGSETAASALNINPFAAGSFIKDNLQPFQQDFLEDISNSFYRLSIKERNLTPHVQKPNAYAWIKAPRHQGHPLQTGPLSRLAIASLAGSNLPRRSLLNQFQNSLKQPPHQANHIAGRLLARSIESLMLLHHVQVLLQRITSTQPTSIRHRLSAKQIQAWGYAEAPAGAVSHHLVLQNGRIQHYDIIAPSTWNGSPLDASGQTGPIESALSQIKQRGIVSQLTASRIIHSFSFSMSDAVH